MTRTALLMAAAFAATSAQAASPSYVGTWATNPSQCKVGQEMEDAPLILTAKRYDQHEAHCTFASVAKRGAGYSAKAKCMVEGNAQRTTMTFTVAGDRLTITDEAGSRTLRRCP